MIKPSSSKYKVLPGSMAMISKKKFAMIGPIEEKCERFEVLSKIFLRFALVIKLGGPELFFFEHVK